MTLIFAIFVHLLGKYYLCVLFASLKVLSSNPLGEMKDKEERIQIH